MHRAAYHFIKALGIPTLTKTKRKTSQESAADENANGDEGEEDEADIDTSLEIDASADDAEAMAATIVVDFEPGDTLGKLMAFVNQVRVSSDIVREYLAEICRLWNIKELEIRLWVCSRWGSLSHCLEVTLVVQKVRLFDSCITSHYADILEGNRLFLSHCR
jgi:hypothetical protein